MLQSYSWLSLNWASLNVVAAFVDRSHCFVKANKVVFQELLSEPQTVTAVSSSSFTDIKVNLSRGLWSLYSKGKLFLCGKQYIWEEGDNRESRSFEGTHVMNSWQTFRSVDNYVDTLAGISLPSRSSPNEKDWTWPLYMYKVLNLLLLHGAVCSLINVTKHETYEGCIHRPMYLSLVLFDIYRVIHVSALP